VNRLASETSPYLRQHASNPVDWYPFGPEALERARTEDRPIFLSVGYSACHWCHVMEEESFSDARVAALMNEHFVNVKVDREERPDVDDVYMRAVQAMTGAGGWPMSVFITPELEPFFGGTYFPPYRQYGRPGFTDVLASVAHGWKNDRERLLKRGQAFARQLQREAERDTSGRLEPDLLDRSAQTLLAEFDPLHGGFDSAPKFPRTADVRLVLRHARRTGEPALLHAAAFTLDRMARGGIHDQLAGGFHRYSVDDEWLVPHFEKMLYDTALLVPAYLEGFLATEEESFAAVARSSCEWMLQEMRVPVPGSEPAPGGFASALDADSEGEEGRFYVWTTDELDQVLGRKLGRLAALAFGAEPEGNFEGGANVLSRPQSPSELAATLGRSETELASELEQLRATLLEARARRVRPARDEKVLCSWNALAVTALAQAAQVLDEPRFLTAGQEAMRFLRSELRLASGDRAATWCDGRAQHPALLDDRAYLVQALLELYQTDFDPEWLRAAVEEALVVRARFADTERGGWYTTPADGEVLLSRLKSPQDGALPAGYGIHVQNCLALAELTADSGWASEAEAALVGVGGAVRGYPRAFSSILSAADFLAAGPREIVVGGAPEAARGLLRAIRSSWCPQRVVALLDAEAPLELQALLEGKQGPPEGALAWICRHYACAAPLDCPEAVRAALAE